MAFEVVPPDASESLIRRHPPRKFQKLEDQPQGNVITQESLEEKQAIAERRRQEVRVVGWWRIMVVGVWLKAE